jgi:hypothetical protein
VHCFELKLCDQSLSSEEGNASCRELPTVGVDRGKLPTNATQTRTNELDLKAKLVHEVALAPSPSFGPCRVAQHITLPPSTQALVKLLINVRASLPDARSRSAVTGEAEFFARPA